VRILAAQSGNATARMQSESAAELDTLLPSVLGKAIKGEL